MLIVNSLEFRISKWMLVLLGTLLFDPWFIYKLRQSILIPHICQCKYFKGSVIFPHGKSKRNFAHTLNNFTQSVWFHTRWLILHTVCNFAQSVYFTWSSFTHNLRYFVASQFVLKIYALLSVKFAGLKMCQWTNMRTNMRYVNSGSKKRWRAKDNIITVRIGDFPKIHPNAAILREQLCK